MAGLLDKFKANIQGLLTELDPRSLLDFGNGQTLQEAMQNRMQPGSLRPNLSNQQMVDAGLNIAGMAPVGMFIGKGAKTWDAVKARQAMKMEAKGIDPRTIWKETGNWKAPDGMWRQEIPDNAAKLDGPSWRSLSEGQEPGAGYLDEVLNHRKLFEAYPDMRSRGMSYDEGNGLAALYNMDSQIYGMNPKAFQSGGFKIDGDSINQVTNKDSYNTAKSALLHEGMHDIQKTEGWATGGTPEEMGSFEDYFRLLGEAEARATQARMNMDTPERLAKFPEDSYDVPIDQLIYKYGDGKSGLLGNRFLLPSN